MNDKPEIKIGVMVLPDGNGFMLVRVKPMDYIRLCYDMIDFYYNDDDVPAGVYYCVKFGGLTQGLLWNAYDKCSMDVSVVRRLGGILYDV